MTKAQIAFQKSKAKYDKPKTKLRRASLQPLPKLKKRADRALQDFYRREWAGMACEGCGGEFDLMHHFFPKSSSARLRFEEKNLIFICHGCHTKHHLAGDPRIHARIIKKRGTRWYNSLEKMKRETFSLDRPYLEAQLKKYSKVAEIEN